ncbi:4'-phosphopantetheinyl transferase superfamily protein [Flavobacterium sp. KACC 22763]|uniref:4'-phosphopantetheinyl transferase superfamily protein n=1 Tax=Flavobacterium sp. KACC 22763 TaxID=3025668 RepID=UPI002365AB37|nr:4'-phosphopantetheinyl transferase superfamily protein [Flavobacterium sp. KACC 22763]WDF65884.1 4'-phosphopantetheinyl transferase superfamily protein [Flavobacterium sp. KACC 22763]
MIGNDIIDLAQSRVESRWQRKGFIEKLFTKEEQQYIKDSEKPEIMVWLLWSMKEAAYKIYNRQTKIREFSPKKLCCSLNFLNSNLSLGKVTCNENTYYTKSIFSLESIHTIAVDNLENIKNIIEVENKKIIKDENGIPYLKMGNRLQYISISHHGRFEKWVTLRK